MSNLADLARSIRDTAKYGHVPPKLVITTPWNALCVDLIGPYTLNGKDSSSIDIMCLTMFDPATSLFVFSNYRNSRERLVVAR